MDKNKALLVVSFGTLHSGTLKRTVGAIENDLSSAFPERKFYRAFTSRMILKKLAENGVFCDDLTQSLERMKNDGMTDILIQPTHMLEGEEFDSIRETVCAYSENFDEIRLGAPLLADENDIEEMAEAIEEIFSYIDDNDMLALMGHGSRHQAFPAYTLLGARLKSRGNIGVGTLEYEPGIEPVIEMVRERRPQKVYLAPLLVAAGAHAMKDMSGDSPKSWKSRIEKENTAAECIMKGMGEYKQVRDIYIRHAQNGEKI